MNEILGKLSLDLEYKKNCMVYPDSVTDLNLKL